MINLKSSNVDKPNIDRYVIEMAKNESNATGKRIEEVAGYYQNQIRNMEPALADALVMGAINDVCRNYGARANTKETTDEMVDLVLTKFSHLAPEEILEAFRQKAAGEFKVKGAEAYGGVFNAELIGKVLTGYNEKRKEELSAYLKAKNKAEYIRDREAKKEAAKKQYDLEFPQLIEKARQEINHYSEIPVHWYDTCQRLGWINFTDEIKKEYWDKAKEEVERLKLLEIEEAEHRTLREQIENEYSKGFDSKRKNIAVKMLIFDKLLKNQDWVIPVVKFER